MEISAFTRNGQYYGENVIPTISSEIQIPFLDLKSQYASIKEEILEAVHAVLESAHYVSGERVERFEDEFARYVGARYVVGVSSGTAALELALQATNIGPGDEVIVPANSFFASAEAVSHVGARPVFADVNPVTFHLDASSVQDHLTPRTRAVLPVHLYGRAADLREIEELAAMRNLQIIEDACQAHGARRNGVHVGGSGQLTCFSFYPGKNLGAYGDAGAIACNDHRQAQMLRILRDPGSPRIGRFRDGHPYPHPCHGLQGAALEVQGDATCRVARLQADGGSSIRIGSEVRVENRRSLTGLAEQHH